MFRNCCALVVMLGLSFVSTNTKAVEECTNLTEGCIKIVEEGRLRFLEIGSTMDEVLHDAASSGVAVILPTVDEYIQVTKRNPGELDSLFGSTGIQIRGKGSYTIRLAFDGNNLSSTYFSVHVPEAVRSLFRIGQTKESVFRAIKKLLSDKSVSYVHNMIPKSRWIDIRPISSTDKDYLTSYTSWEFGKSGEYSHFKLTFKENKLVRIVYRWSSVELP